QTGANGGSANAQASGIARDQVTITAIATGGAGGQSGGQGGGGGSATLSSGGLGPAGFCRSATGGTVPRAGTPPGGGSSQSFGPPPGGGASVSLTSNGGVNDAIGGATSGTLNLTQTAIGGNGGFAGNAASILIGTNPFGSSSYNLNANATGGNGTLS